MCFFERELRDSSRGPLLLILVRRWKNLCDWRGKVCLLIVCAMYRVIKESFHTQYVIGSSLFPGASRLLTWNRNRNSELDTCYPIDRNYIFSSKNTVAMKQMSFIIRKIQNCSLKRGLTRFQIYKYTYSARNRKSALRSQNDILAAELVSALYPGRWRRTRGAFLSRRIRCGRRSQEKKREKLSRSRARARRTLLMKAGNVSVFRFEKLTFHFASFLRFSFLVLCRAEFLRPRSPPRSSHTIANEVHQRSRKLRAKFRNNLLNTILKYIPTPANFLRLRKDSNPKVE